MEDYRKAGFDVENDHVAEILMLSYQDPDSLTPIQFTQLMSLHAEWMSIVYATYELRRNGAISEETWIIHSNYYLLFLQTEWLQEFWRNMNHEGLYPAEFMEDLESRLPPPIVMGSGSG